MTKTVTRPAFTRQLMALALATTMVAVVSPAQAAEGVQAPVGADAVRMAEDGDRGLRSRGASAEQRAQRSERRAQRSESRGLDRRGGSEQRAQRRETQRSERSQAQLRPSRSENTSRGEERRGRDWNRSDRRADIAKERSGRDWNMSSRSDTRTNERTAPTRSERLGARGKGDDTRLRNRSYTDGSRNTSYRDGRRDRDGDGRVREWRRDGDGWRDRDGNRYENRHRDRDQRYAKRDRHHRHWDHDWRRHASYDWYRYRSHNRSLYRLGSYYSPYRDWRYNRLNVGFSLRPLFYSSRYWINDPWRYRLPPVHGDYRWVRYYDDVLLIDTWNGEIVDVIHDFFW